MAEKHDQLAAQIIALVGGSQNIRDVKHCITRLRFWLKDIEFPDTEAIKNLDGVLRVQVATGQYQVVIGPQVARVYDAVMAQLPELVSSSDDSVAVDAEKPRGIMGVLDTISACFIPMLPFLISGCIVKGLLSLAVALGLSDTSGIYLVLSGFGEAALMFVPPMVGYGAAKRYGLDPIYGIGLGLIFCSSTWQIEGLATGDPIGSILGVDYYQTILGLPLMPVDYQISPIAIIPTVWFASKLYGLINPHVPDVLRFNITPIAVISITAVAAAMVIGPVFSLITQGLLFVCDAAIGFSPALFGAVLGGTYLLMVMFGVHYCLDPLCYMYLFNYGYDPTWPATDASTWILLGILIGIVLRSHNERLRNVAIGAAVPAFISGTTEPALYGVVVENMKKVLRILIPLSAICGAIFSSLVPGAYVFGGEGLFGWLNYVRTDSWFDVIVYVCVCGSGFIGGLVACLITWRDDVPATDKDAESSVTSGGLTAA